MVVETSVHENLHARDTNCTNLFETEGKNRDYCVEEHSQSEVLYFDGSPDGFEDFRMGTILKNNRDEGSGPNMALKRLIRRGPVHGMGSRHREPVDSIRRLHKTMSSSVALRHTIESCGGKAYFRILLYREVQIGKQTMMTR